MYDDYVIHWSDELTGENRRSLRKPAPLALCPHESHTVYPGMEPGPLRREAGE